LRCKSFLTTTVYPDVSLVSVTLVTGSHYMDAKDYLPDAYLAYPETKRIAHASTSVDIATFSLGSAGIVCVL